LIAEIALTAVLSLTAAQDDPVSVVEPGQKLSEQSSQYVGRHYNAKFEELRKCIRWRESRNAYGANTGTGQYRGAYQLSLDMAVGAGWMIQKELRRTMPRVEVVRIGELLRSTKANLWHPFWQDMAFWIVWDDGAGRSHWPNTNHAGAC